MPEKYYLSVDGGGTKLLALLFNENLELLSVGRSGAINPNFESFSMIQEHMEESINQCMAPFGGEPISIENVWISMPGPAALFERLLRSRCQVEAFTPLSEGDTCLLAGLCRRTGLVVLCGTGATLFYLNPGEPVQARGGWGSPIGDEGSGYDIGLQCIRAAIWSLEGRGSKTVLEERVWQRLGGKSLREGTGQIFAARDARNFIASFCRMVGECAKEGDAVAQRILSEAGEAAALQAEAFIRQAGLPTDTSVVTAGGAWKSSPLMAQAFLRHIFGHYPEVKVYLPCFDPVVGPVVGFAMGARDMLTPEEIQKLRVRYSEFVSQWPEVPWVGRDGRLFPPVQGTEAFAFQEQTDGLLELRQKREELQRRQTS